MKELALEDTAENRRLISKDRRIKATPVGGKLIIDMPEDNKDKESISGLPVEQIND